MNFRPDHRPESEARPQHRRGGLWLSKITRALASLGKSTFLASTLVVSRNVRWPLTFDYKPRLINRSNGSNADAESYQSNNCTQIFIGSRKQPTKRSYSSDNANPLASSLLGVTLHSSPSSWRRTIGHLAHGGRQLSSCWFVVDGILQNAYGRVVAGCAYIGDRHRQ